MIICIIDSSEVYFLTEWCNHIIHELEIYSQ